MKRAIRLKNGESRNKGLPKNSLVVIQELERNSTFNTPLNQNSLGITTCFISNIGAWLKVAAHLQSQHLEG